MDWFLDKRHPDPAYHCGRLFSVIAAIQMAAMPEIKATIRRRYFGAAMTSPATHVGLLLKQCEVAHLPKLDKFERQFLLNELIQVQGSVGITYPRRLSAPEQSTYALGFYHEEGYIAYHPADKYRYITKGGDLVQSSGERIIADALFDLDLDYSYEPAMRMPLGMTYERRIPDFLVHHAEAKRQLFIEYLGMLDRPGYVADWNTKRSEYAKVGIIDCESGGGFRGRLLSLAPGANGNDEVEMLRQIRAALTRRDADA